MPRSIKLVLAFSLVLICSEWSLSQERTFTEDPQILLGLRTDRSPSLTFADIDADGDLDVLVASGRHWAQQNEVFINNGLGGFTLGYPLGAEFSTSYSIPVADIDGDGDLDALVANDLAPNMVYLNDGHGVYTRVDDLGPEVESTRDVILADLNGDRLPDAIVTNRGMENGIYLNEGGIFGAKRGFGTNDIAGSALRLFRPT